MAASNIIAMPTNFKHVTSAMLKAMTTEEKAEYKEAANAYFDSLPTLTRKQAREIKRGSRLATYINEVNY